MSAAGIQQQCRALRALPSTPRACAIRRQRPAAEHSGWQPDLAGPCSSSCAPSRVYHHRQVRCQSYESPQRVADEEYMKEYADLKTTLLDNTRKAGAGIAFYMLLTVDGETALCAFIGMGFSTLYLQWLFRDVDNVKGTDRVPMMEARQIESPVTRVLAMWLASYRHSLQPRLIVPIAMAALIGAYNQLADPPLTGFQEVSLLFGFLSYKFALVYKVVDELSPKEFVSERTRPTIERVDDGELELDRWGRPKKPQFTMPTEALPEDVDPNNMGGLPSLLAKTALRVDADAEVVVPEVRTGEAPGAVGEAKASAQQQGTAGGRS